MTYARPWNSTSVAADTVVYSDAVYIGVSREATAQISYTQPRILAIAASLVVEDLTYTAKTAGAAGNSITIEYIDPPGNNVALSVAVAGTAIAVTLATNGSSVVTSTAAQIKAAIDAKAEAAALVSVAVTGTGTDVQSAAVATPLASGADETDGAISGRFYFQGSSELSMPPTGDIVAWSTLDQGESVSGAVAGSSCIEIADLGVNWIRIAFVPSVSGSDVTAFTAALSYKGR